jgi:hypothetical protein
MKVTLLAAVVLPVVYLSVISHGTFDRVASARATEALADLSADSTTAAEPGPILFQDRFDRPDGLITNEYAFWNRRLRAVKSLKWQVTSGSFFAHDGTGWTGMPDRVRPNVDSSNGTDSAVFRLTTRAANFGDVTVSFLLRNDGLVSTPQTPPHAWDGVHLFLRYRSPAYLYYLSLERRDGKIVVKKKCPNGPLAQGTYYTIGRFERQSFPLRRWVRLQARVQTEAGGDVVIALVERGRTVLTATDPGIGCDPIPVGAVGLRGDNDNFQIDDFTIAGTWSQRRLELTGTRGPGLRNGFVPPPSHGSYVARAE